MKLIKSLKKSVNKKFKLDTTILFGSRARGDYLLDSDVDMIFVSKKFSRLNFRRRMGEIIEMWDEWIDIEPLCYTPEEFEIKRKQLGIVRQAVKEGIEI